MKSITFENVTKSYGKTQVVKLLNLEIKEGERLILLGPSGCGKSTTLRMLCGFEEITSGNLYLGDTLANNIESGDRNMSMVFQNYALYPHMTVFDNISYGLKINKIPKSEIQIRVNEAIKVLDLEGLEQRFPRELSGGQRQRIALARAIVKRSDYFLLDEPLSNLDAQLRGHARKELVKIHEMYGQTFVYVTHDQIEAMTIGDRIALMHEGYIQMIDTPYKVYNCPKNIFAAKFIGSPSMNIIDCKVDGNNLILGKQKITLPEIWAEKIKNSGAKEFKFGVRPENVVLSTKASGENIKVGIKYIEDYGNRVGLYFDVEGQEVISIMNENVVTDNRELYYNVNFNKIHFFDKDTTESIGYPDGI